jgi:phosphoglycolate phosphatase
MYVFFDLDGTLTDPKEGIVACIRFALSSLNIEIDEDVKLETFIGPPLRDTFRQLCENEILAEKAVNLYRERFSNTGLYENRLYDGIEECLESLIGKVRSNYVVTSKPTGFSERIVEHFNISEHFEVVYGSNLDGSLGDKTELLAHVLNSEGINPEDAVMIGDRKFDVIGAKNHGIRSIGVLWGYGSEQELREAGAESICENPLQLHDHIFT